MLEEVYSEVNFYRLAALALTLFMFLFLFSGLYFQAPEVKAKASKVVDGDTFRMRLKNEQVTVRLRGVDAPETSVMNTPGEFGMRKDSWRCLEKWGYQAQSRVGKLLDGENFTLVYRRNFWSQQKGEYGRLLGRVYVNGTNLNKLLVRKGLARSYGGSLPELQERARERNRGLWKCGE